jgi:hypothetical protein
LSPPHRFGIIKPIVTKTAAFAQRMRVAQMLTLSSRRVFREFVLTFALAAILFVPLCWALRWVLEWIPE